MKPLGFGCMRLPVINNEFSNVDKASVSAMFDCFISNGFSYVDTAWFYHNENSERAIKECLVDRYPRESFQLADKMPVVLLNDEAELPAYFEKQLEKCGVEFFDYYLLHDMGKEHYALAEKIHAFEFISKMKKEHRVTNIGFSFHDTADVLDEILTAHPELDFVQLQLNYLDWDSIAVQSKLCYETAVRHGKPVIVMEPVKGGTLARIPEAAERIFKEYAPERSNASWAIRFAASHKNVIMVLSGMSSMEQLTDNISCMKSFKPLSTDEFALINKAAEIIKSNVAISCTGCSYCTLNCPEKIAIPKYFSLYNTDMQEMEGKAWTPQGFYYNNLTLQFGKASNCIQCGQCEKMCPQHLPIKELLNTVAEHFER